MPLAWLLSYWLLQLHKGRFEVYMKPWIITDWAGNDLTYHHGTFESFDDAEYALDIFLGDNYETDRGEYYIVEKE